jgi:predicted nucleotidyltransferase
MLTNDELKTIKNILITELSPYLVILFGSVTENREREDSDIDLAYLSDRVYTDYQRFMLAQRLASRMKRDVDLVDLQRVSTVMQMQILHHGNVIFCDDEKRRIAFQMKVYKMYAKLNEERMPILREIKRRGSVYES